MSSNDSGSCVKTLGVIAAIVGIAGGIIGILTFVTGRQNLPEILSVPPTPTVRQSTSGDSNTASEPTMTPRSVNTPSGISTPPGIYDPTEIVAAGQPIYVDDLLLSVNQNSISTEYEYISVKVTIENVGNDQKTIRFLANSISLSDDAGNDYALHIGNECKETDLFSVKQYTLRSGQDVIIGPKVIVYPWNWCSDLNVLTMPAFTGPIAVQAGKLYITFTDFGPFSGFTVEIDL